MINYHITILSTVKCQEKNIRADHVEIPVMGVMAIIQIRHILMQIVATTMCIVRAAFFAEDVAEVK